MHCPTSQIITPGLPLILKSPVHAEHTPKSHLSMPWIMSLIANIRIASIHLWPPYFGRVFKSNIAGASQADIKNSSCLDPRGGQSFFGMAFYQNVAALCTTSSQLSRWSSTLHTYLSNDDLTQTATVHHDVSINEAASIYPCIHFFGYVQCLYTLTANKA